MPLPQPTRKDPLGSASWILSERQQAHELISHVVEDFGYCVRNEIDWLNEHMRDIFYSQTGRINVSDAFKTPGRLRGKTPRTARRQQFLQASTRSVRTRDFLGLAAGSGVLTHSKASNTGLYVPKPPSPQVRRIVSAQNRADFEDVFGPGSSPPKNGPLATPNGVGITSPAMQGSPAFRSMLERVASGNAQEVLPSKDASAAAPDSDMQQDENELPTRQTQNISRLVNLKQSNSIDSGYADSDSIRRGMRRSTESSDGTTTKLKDLKLNPSSAGAKTKKSTLNTQSKPVQSDNGNMPLSPVPILSSSPEPPQRLPAITPSKSVPALRDEPSYITRKAISPSKPVTKNKFERAAEKAGTVASNRNSPVKRIQTAASAFNLGSPSRTAGITRYPRFGGFNSPTKSPQKTSVTRIQNLAQPSIISRARPQATSNDINDADNADDIDDDYEEQEKPMPRKSSINFASLPGRDRSGKSIGGRPSTLGGRTSSNGARSTSGDKSLGAPETNRDALTQHPSNILRDDLPLQSIRSPQVRTDVLLSSPTKNFLKEQTHVKIGSQPTLKSTPTQAETDPTIQTASTRSGFFFGQKKSANALSRKNSDKSMAQTPTKGTLSNINTHTEPATPTQGQSPSRKFNDATASAKAKLFSVFKSARGIFASSVGLSAQAKMEALSATAPANAHTIAHNGAEIPLAPSPAIKPISGTSTVHYPTVPPSPIRKSQKSALETGSDNSSGSGHSRVSSTNNASARPRIPLSKSSDSKLNNPDSQSVASKLGFGYKTLKGKSAVATALSLNSSSSQLNDSSSTASNASRRPVPTPVSTKLAQRGGPFPNQPSTAALSASLADSLGPSLASKQGQANGQKTAPVSRMVRKPSTTSLSGNSTAAGSIRSRAVEAARKKQQQDRERAEKEKSDRERERQDKLKAERERLEKEQEARKQQVRTLPINPAKPAKRPLGDDSANATTASARQPTATQAARSNPPSQPSQDSDNKRRRTLERGPAPAPVRPSVSSQPLRQAQPVRQSQLHPPSQVPALQNKFSQGYLKPPPISSSNAGNSSSNNTQYKTPAKTLASARAALVASTVKATATIATPQQFPSGEDITLPEIKSDEESYDEDSEDEDNQNPSWAQSPNLNDLLRDQQTIDPESVFGPIAPLQMEEIFRNRAKKKNFRSRTSSANWISSGDQITEEEKIRDRELRAQLIKEGRWTYKLGR